MTLLAQAIIVVCIVVLTAALISTLRALRKTAVRAEEVLHVVEREIRPMASQIEGLAEEVRTLAHNANDNMERVGVIVGRAEDISFKAARLVGAVSGLTRVGQYAGVAAGVKRGLDVFINRLRNRQH